VVLNEECALLGAAAAAEGGREGRKP